MNEVTCVAFCYKYKTNVCAFGIVCKFFLFSSQHRCASGQWVLVHTPRGDAGLTKLNLVYHMGWVTGEMVGDGGCSAQCAHRPWGPLSLTPLPVDNAAGASSSPHTFIWCWVAGSVVENWF